MATQQTLPPITEEGKVRFEKMIGHSMEEEAKRDGKPLRSIPMELEYLGYTWYRKTPRRRVL